MFGLKLTNVSNFLPLKVAGHSSETQLQVGKKCDYLIQILKT